MVCIHWSLATCQEGDYSAYLELSALFRYNAPIIFGNLSSFGFAYIGEILGVKNQDFFTHWNPLCALLDLLSPLLPSFGRILLCDWHQARQAAQHRQAGWLPVFMWQTSTRRISVNQESGLTRPEPRECHAVVHHTDKSSHYLQKWACYDICTVWLAFLSLSLPPSPKPQVLWQATMEAPNSGVDPPTLGLPCPVPDLQWCGPLVQSMELASLYPCLHALAWAKNNTVRPPFRHLGTDVE